MKRTSIVIDIHRCRCDHCNVALHNELAVNCPVCGAMFDTVISNHFGLATKLAQRRATAGIYTCAARCTNTAAEPVELIGA